MDTGPRVVVIGTSGAGKTTLARNLAARLECSHIELDALHWLPEWEERDAEAFRGLVSQAVAADRWTLCGNYGSVRDIVWPRATTIVWLDYSFPRVMGQVTLRTLRRSLAREELWNTNRESFRKSFASKDSILLWSLTTWGRRRREIPRLLAEPLHDHLRVLRFSAPRRVPDDLETSL